MATIKNINPSSKSNPDIGFGVQVGQIGGRFVNKDGSFNLRKEGLPLFTRVSIYSWFLELSWWRFIAVILVFCLFVNLIFTAVYVLIGMDQLEGIVSITQWGKIKEVFFFSTQTFTTVGYGRINPIRDGADLTASLESICGWMIFAFITGLLYGRFTRPQAYLAFSDHALISPYHDGTGLMFRMAPYKINHDLTDARVVVNLGFMVNENNNPTYKFYQLKLERTRIDTFNMNWTVVHPIDEESPLLNFTEEDMQRSDLELYVQVTGFDATFSNIVMQRTSYTYKEIIWGGKFKAMYHESVKDSTTVLELDKLNDYEKVKLPL